MFGQGDLPEDRYAPRYGCEGLDGRTRSTIGWFGADMPGQPSGWGAHSWTTSCRMARMRGHAYPASTSWRAGEVAGSWWNRRQRNGRPQERAASLQQRRFERSSSSSTGTRCKRPIACASSCRATRTSKSTSSRRTATRCPTTSGSRTSGTCIRPRARQTEGQTDIGAVAWMDEASRQALGRARQHGRAACAPSAMTR